MYQETHSSDPGRGGRLIFFFALLIALLAVRLFMNAASRLPYGGAIQIGLVLALILAFLQIYKRRLCSYRYTVFHREPDPNERDAFGDPVRLSHPLGTLVFQRIDGKKEKILEEIAPAEMVALLPPGESFDSSGLKPILAASGKASAHTLIYRRDGKVKALHFCPSEKMQEILQEIICAVNDCSVPE